MRFHEIGNKRNVKFSTLYLDTQKSFIRKKRLTCTMYYAWIALISTKRWQLDVLTFLIHGFAFKNLQNFLVIMALSTLWIQVKFSSISLQKFPPRKWRSELALFKRDVQSIHNQGLLRQVVLSPDLEKHAIA